MYGTRLMTLPPIFLIFVQFNMRVICSTLINTKYSFSINLRFLKTSPTNNLDLKGARLI